MQPNMTRTALPAAFLVLLVLPDFALADAAQAKKYIAEAKSMIESRGWDDCESRLKLAEGELDDASYGFDRAGNLVTRADQRGELALKWDANQRLAESRANGASTT